MKYKVIAVFMLLFLALPMLSCIVTSRDTHVEISCDEFAENPTGVRNEFNIETGDKVYVELCSNPTTGFEWSYKMSGDMAVKEEDHDYEEPDGNVTGASGIEKWTFEGVSKGTAEILMEYSQPWDGGIKQEWIYSLTITVE
ncbi:protease inhibitor I42 family protein [Chloroflexota bacterium]